MGEGSLGGKEMGMDCHLMCGEKQVLHWIMETAGMMER